MKDNIITRLFSGSKSKSFASDIANQDLLGWHVQGSSLRHYEANQYENGYASIQAIVKRFSTTIPFAIDGNGKPLQDQNITNVLARPNRDMSGLDFREALAVMSLVHDKVYIRVHHNGTRLTEASISGFTFLEGVAEVEIDGEITYRTGKDTYTRDDIIVLQNINPYDLSKGFSVARAAKRWTRIDDYIADYQSGFFENGAVPAGQFVVSAPTADDYRDIVKKMQDKHRGAGKNNNVTYSYAPIDPATGKPGQANITWVPYNNTNKDLDLSALFDQVNKKVDSVYAVPASIRGVNDNNTYASVRVDEGIFIDQTVRPFAQKLWTRFTHELNRITGGLGYAITIDIDTPNIAEEEKTDAERKQVEMNLITTMVEKGYKLDTIVEAFELSTAYKLLKMAPVPKDAGVTTQSSDDIQKLVNSATALIRSGFTAEASLIAVGLNPVEHTGFLPVTLKTDAAPLPEAAVGEAGSTATPTASTAGTTGVIQNDKPEVDNGDEVQDSPTATKAVHVQRTKTLSETERTTYEERIGAVTRGFMSDYIENVIDNLPEDLSKAPAIDTNDLHIAFAGQLYDVIIPAMISKGIIDQQQGIQLLAAQGAVVGQLDPFTLSIEQSSWYRKYLKTVATSYNEDTAESIRNTIASARETEMSAYDLKSKLRGIINSDEYRVRRLAVSETNRIGGKASVYAMENIQNQTGIRVSKVWQTSNTSDACEYCSGLNGKEVAVEGSFAKQGERIQGNAGGTLVNDFVDMDTADAHPHCKCYTTYRVVR